MLVCPVRNCGRALVREPRRWVCSAGHSFDIARSGYANLLQPQDRRSKNPGDTARMINGRRRLHDAGLTKSLFQSVFETAAAAHGDVILDVGAGDGFYLGSLARETGCDAHGIDISIPAITAASKRFPDCEWIVANADRFIPYASETFSLLISINSRLNPEEFARVLKRGGRLLVAVSSPEDLRELRGNSRDRVPRTTADFERRFHLVQRRRVTTTVAATQEIVEDLRHAIYLPRTRGDSAITEVTLGLDLLLFQLRLDAQ